MHDPARYVLHCGKNHQAARGKLGVKARGISENFIQTILGKRSPLHPKLCTKLVGVTRVFKEPGESPPEVRDTIKLVASCHRNVIERSAIRSRAIRQRQPTAEYLRRQFQNSRVYRKLKHSSIVPRSTCNPYRTVETRFRLRSESRFVL
jgi:hypothetical protein